MKDHIFNIDVLKKAELFISFMGLRYSRLCAMDLDDLCKSCEICGEIISNKLQ